ncbi:hypothetical protein KUDE01_027769, partial [Dissostichus eleginoides]
MAMFLLLLSCLHLLFMLLHVGDCFRTEPNLSDSSCAGSPAPDLSYQRGVRYTYRYSTTITTTLHGSSAGRNGLALDCVVDIDVVSKCHLMMQIRNPQIKRLSPQKEHSVQRLKSLRDSLERTRLKFSLHGGKVTALCLQEGEQVWALNIKRALLSMLQTSRMASKQELVKETDVYGTCSSKYERRGAVLLKSRDLKQCQQARLAHFWPHSVALTEDTSVQSELNCIQKHGSTVMEEVNCTEVVSMATWSGTAGLVKTKTVSTLLLLRAQPGTPSGADSVGLGVLTDLQFEDEGAARPGKARASTPQQASQTVRMLCSLTSDQQLLSQEFLELAFQLRDLTLAQLKTLWQEASFKCLNDWQPLLDALPACGSEHCIVLLTDLMRNKELEEEQAYAFLTTMALIPHPSPQIIEFINALLQVQELRSKALLAGSCLVYQLCQKSQASCSELPQVQSFIQTLEETLKEGCEEEHPTQAKFYYALKSVGNIGLSAPTFIPLLKCYMLSPSTALELRLAAIQAFRRFPCSADRSVLLQLYRSSQEDPEVRIAAYQQLMHCPDQDVFEVVKTTLRNETSSQVGSYVWSHLTNVLRSEDPMKQPLIESLPDDIISRDFEAEFLKYSFYSDYTISSGMGITNVETSLVFSPKSFLPRSASANLTLYLHGRAHNLLEVDLHIENAEPLLRNVFGQQNSDGESQAQSPKSQSKEASRTRRRTEDGRSAEKEACLSDTSSYLSQARAMLFGRRRSEENRPRCWVGVKVFGNELSVFSCEDLYNQLDHLSLSVAGLAVKLLKGQEVQLNHRAVLMTDELVLPSLSGLPIKLGINMTSLLSLRLKGNINYRDTSHFSLTGYIKPNAYVGLSARMGVDGALGQAAVDWVSELRSSTSLDGSVQLQEGRDVRVTLNTPEDVMDIISLSSRVFQLSGDHREEIRGPKSRVQKTSCTPKTWSKMVGWQLCSNASYPSAATGVSLPAPGPVHLSLRLLKLDRGLHYYMLEAAYSLQTQRGTWLPREASIHFLLATPQSSIPRDMSLDLTFNPHRLLLRITHPLKTIHIQGQLQQERNVKSGKLELIIDGVHYYVMAKQRTRYHLEAKMAADGLPMILSANVTRGLGRKTSFSATVKNVFRETASLSVSLERRRDASSRQYSVEAELLLPGVVGTRMLGLMEQKGSVWSSALRLKYGLGGDARHLRQECYTSQRLRRERDSNLTYIMRAEHEFYCSNTAPINHKIHLRHEESPVHIKSSLDVSYGKHWDEINNKRTLLLSQSFKNQSTQNHTSYTLEFSLQVPEKNLNYRTQLMHSHLKQLGSESSTHLKIHYNNLMPLVAGLHWKSPPKGSSLRKWEGSLTMDSPWLYVFTSHRLTQQQSHSLQLTSELTASKWLNIRTLMLEALYRSRGRGGEARLEISTAAAQYIQAGGWAVVGKRGVKASGSLSSFWTPPLRGDVSLEASKSSHTLHMTSTCGRHNASLSAALNTVDKNLKKRQAILKMTFSKPKSPSTELEFEGVVEELRKDKKMYQKRAMLQLRQPFQTFPQTFLLRETFTVDLLKGLYILESKAGFHGNREVIHTLTLGYKPPSPFVCSALVHPFGSDTIPSDSEVCVTLTSNQTQRDIQGRLRVGSKERLTFFGQVQFNPLHSTHQEIKVRANFSHLLQLQLPSSAIVEGNVGWNPKDNSDFDYQAGGKLRIERQECQLSVQLNGTSRRVGLYSSLTHPFKSKIPKTLEVQATADVSAVRGTGSSSVHVRADGKDRVKLDAQMSHSFQRGERAMGLTVNVSQSLLPSASDLHVNMAANMSSDSVSLHGSYTQGHEALLAQLKGSLKDTGGLQLAVSGDLRHSMASLAVLPTVLGLDGLLGQSDTLIEGQLRVRVMETLYSVELRHQEALGDILDREDEEGMMGTTFHMARDWLCVRSGAEHLCMNASRRIGDGGMGEIYTRLSHSFVLLNATGVPASSDAQLRWAQDGGRLSVFAELHAGAEHLKAEFNGGKTDQLTQRWEFFSRLHHHFKALLKRGVSSSILAKAHYQLEKESLDTGVVLQTGDERVVDILFNVGSKNSAAILELSLWQQMKILQGVIPTSLQMNCTGDSSAERLSAQCYGNVSGRPVEVRVFRSYRPHNRLCYGLSLAHFSLSARAKGCYGPNSQTELRTNLTHSSVLMLTYLGVPTKSSLRLLLRPGPQRWALSVGLVCDPWRMDLNVGLRLERPGLYGWHGLLEFGGRGVTHKAELTGRMKLESWCNIWADVNVNWDSLTSSLLLSVRCKGVGRLTWVQVRRVEGGVPQKTSLTVNGLAGKDGFTCSLGLESVKDSCQCFLSVLLKDRKAEVGWTLQHHWASLTSIFPNKIELQGSGELSDTSLSGSAMVSFNTRSALMDLTTSWEPFTSLKVMLQQNLTHTRVPSELTVSMLTTAGRAELEVESDACSVLFLTNQQKGEDRRSSWSFFVHQRCVLLKTLLAAQTSANISITRSGCSTDLRAVLHADGEQKGSLSVHSTCSPQLSLRASVQHSIEAVQMLGLPAHGAFILNVSAAHLPGVEVGVELGRCYFRGHLGKTQDPQTEEEPASYAVNVTNHCPALQETVLPVSLTLRGLLSVGPCQLTMTSSLRADSEGLSLELGQVCRLPRLSGSLTHSFSGLRSLGVPQTMSIEASAPDQAGALLIKAGTCSIRANGVSGSSGRTPWLWALDAQCPLLQAHLNGSVWQDPLGVWTVTVDTNQEDKRGFLRLNARAWPELSVEGELRHDLPALRGLPQHGRLRVSCRAGEQRYDGEALLQLEQCTVGASGAVMSQTGLQGALLYHNNCTLIQEWGSPDRMEYSGALVVSPTLTESRVSMAIDEAELKASVVLKETKDINEASLSVNHSVPMLKKMGLPVSAALTMHSGSHGNGSYYYLLHSSAGSQKLTQEMSVSQMSESVRVKSLFRHTVSVLRRAGVPADCSMQVELGSAGGKAFTLQSQFGGQQAGVRLRMKSLPTSKEMRGSMWHGWSWLRGRGLPRNIEGLCSVQGVFSQLQSGVRLSVDGQQLLSSGLNVSVSDGRLALLLSFSPPAANLTGTQNSLNTTITAQFKGPLRSASADIHCPHWRVRAVGDVGGWGAHGGSKEARVTLRHTVQGFTSPALQVEAWGRLTESQLRCSIALNPELSSSLALIMQGHHRPHSKDLMVKVVQNIPRMLVYLPPQLNIRSQLNQSQSGVAGLVEVSSGRRRLWAVGELTAIESGYRQAVELKHSYPQLRPLPRTVAVRTVYEARSWSHQVQHGAVWGSQELVLSGLYSAPPALQQGNHTLKVQVSCVPRGSRVEVTLERSPQGGQDSVGVGWVRHGLLEQVRAESWWRRSEESSESRVELQQPFSSTLSSLSLHRLTHSALTEQRTSHQTHLSWNNTVPVNISISLNKQWQNNSSRGQACALFSTQQMAVSSVKGCVSVGQEGNSYSQNAELRWDNRSVKQGLKYQRGPRGMHSLQVNVGLDKVSPVPCHSHTLLTKIQTNLRNRLEHTVLLGLCPPQP